MDITLIDAVRKARAKNYRYIAVDKNCRMHGYRSKPNIPFKAEWDTEEQDINRYLLLGEYKLTCSWKETLIKLSDVKVSC